MYSRCQKIDGSAGIRYFLFGDIQRIRHQVVEFHNFVLIHFLAVFDNHEEIFGSGALLCTVFLWIRLVEGSEDLLDVTNLGDPHFTKNGVVQSHT